MNEEIFNETGGGEQQTTKKERREQKREERRALESANVKKSSRRKAALWVISLLILGGVGFAVVRLAIMGSSDTNDSTPTVTSDITADDWIRGNPAASVSLLEYGDFQCPACGSYYLVVKQLKSEFGENIKFVFRNFPLKQPHPNAMAASTAAEAAGAQGKFWEMHDLLFERQSDWSRKPTPKATFISYAEELGLNKEQFENDMALDEIEKAINVDFEAGLKSGVNATPTFFLNGVKIENPTSYEDFKTLLANAIAATASEKNSQETSSTTHETVPAP